MTEEEKDFKVIKLPPEEYDYYDRPDDWKPIRPENRKGKKK